MMSMSWEFEGDSDGFLPKLKTTVTILTRQGKVIDINPDDFFEWYLIDFEEGWIRFRNPSEPIITVISATIENDESEADAP